jgi:hypothetical protein
MINPKYLTAIEVGNSAGEVLNHVISFPHVGASGPLMPL